MIKQNIIRYATFLEILRFCKHCANPWGKVDLFCDRCWADLWKLKKPHKDINLNFRVYSLFSWTDEKIISSLIYGLKNGHNEKTVAKLVNQLIIHCKLSCNSASERPYIIPVPSHCNEETDHAQMIAQEIQKTIGGILEQPFIHLDANKQKKRDSQERRQVKFLVKNCSSLKKFKGKKVILIDDVYTTGSTFKALISHIEKFTKNITCIALVRRPLFGKESIDESIK